MSSFSKMLGEKPVERAIGKEGGQRRKEMDEIETSSN